MATDVLPRREGSAYIEGGSRYQQRTDTYNDLIEELLWEEKPVQEDSKEEIVSELLKTSEQFYKSGKISPLDKSKAVPIYADYVLSGSDDGSGSAASAEPTQVAIEPITITIERPVLAAVFERVEIEVPKPLDTEHTIHTAKPKKQKKKRKPRVVITNDDEPIKTIEIIRS